MVEEADPVVIVQIQMDGARTSTSGLALTIDTGSTSVPIARNCVNYVVSPRSLWKISAAC